mmetsp:Transcript_6018/g.14582  ORF Transcript_6018/g.14582 Transcript_6018/m.14582 type:complete len:229 (-) Transcript_6018:142-828(-)
MDVHAAGRLWRRRRGAKLPVDPRLPCLRPEGLPLLLGELLGVGLPESEPPEPPLQHAVPRGRPTALGFARRLELGELFDPPLPLCLMCPHRFVVLSNTALEAHKLVRQLFEPHDALSLLWVRLEFAGRDKIFVTINNRQRAVVAFEVRVLTTLQEHKYSYAARGSISRKKVQDVHSLKVKRKILPPKERRSSFSSWRAREACQRPTSSECDRNRFVEVVTSLRTHKFF